MSGPATAELESGAAARGLSVLGGFHPEAKDGLPDKIATLLLLGPAPGFWEVFEESPEGRDGAPDPLDRWSRRVIGQWACALGAKAWFPFGGPPYHPFLSWAQRTGRVWSSPVGLLVHETHGLMVSFRGALGLQQRLPLPQPPAAAPCASCTAQPCRTACPVSALSDSAPYDVPACKAHLRSPAGRACLSGCAVRRACPVSDGAGRAPGQSQFHMQAFLETP